jgi:RNA polymerase sigma-70 factor (ECF subfamily)
MFACTDTSRSSTRTTTTRKATDSTPNARAKKLSPAPSMELCQGLANMRSDLFGHALRMTRSAAAAEDLVQDTVVRALSFEHCFQRGTNLRAWAHQILFSIFITRCRRNRLERKALEVLTTAPGAWTLPERRPEMVSLSPTMARAMNALPLTYRAVVVLVDLEEMAYKDAAILLGIPLGTVMSRLSRGRRMLAEQVLGTREPLCAAA